MKTVLILILGFTVFNVRLIMPCTALYLYCCTVLYVVSNCIQNVLEFVLHCILLLSLLALMHCLPGIVFCFICLS